MDNHHNPDIHSDIILIVTFKFFMTIIIFDTISLMFMHSVSLQSLQETTHFNPLARQEEHLEFSPHEVLQLHLITFKMSLSVGASSVIIRMYLSFPISSPNHQVLKLQNLNCSIAEVQDSPARSENGQLFFSLVGVLLDLF